VSCRYYYSNVPFLSTWRDKYISISALYGQFKLDVAQGTLPAVSFVDPAFTLLDDGSGSDDHPHADLRRGEIFLRDVVTTLAESSLWKKTVLVINRDEWGGFFDHVVPPRVIAPNAVDTDLVDGKALLGCRVPTIVVSPFARGNPYAPRINSLVYEHTSVLKLIEWRWGLDPLTSRDASDEIANLAHALNFAAPDASMPSLPIIADPPLQSCAANTVVSMSRRTGVRDIQGLDSVERTEHNTDADEKAYDFYVMLKSDLMKGWPLPASVAHL
jgi:phospholipase C